MRARVGACVLAPSGARGMRMRTLIHVCASSSWLSHNAMLGQDPRETFWASFQSKSAQVPIRVSRVRVGWRLAGHCVPETRCNRVQLCKVRPTGHLVVPGLAHCQRQQEASSRGPQLVTEEAAGGLPVAELSNHPGSADSRVCIDGIILRHCRVFAREGKIFAADTAQPRTGWRQAGVRFGHTGLRCRAS